MRHLVLNKCWTSFIKHRVPTVYSALGAWLRALKKLDVFPAPVGHTVMVSALKAGKCRVPGEWNLTLPGGGESEASLRKWYPSLIPEDE